MAVAVVASAVVASAVTVIVVAVVVVAVAAVVAAAVAVTVIAVVAPAPVLGSSSSNNNFADLYQLVSELAIKCMIISLHFIGQLTSLTC